MPGACPQPRSPTSLREQADLSALEHSWGGSQDFKFRVSASPGQQSWPHHEVAGPAETAGSGQGCRAPLGLQQTLQLRSSRSGRPRLGSQSFVFLQFVNSHADNSFQVARLKLPTGAERERGEGGSHSFLSGGGSSWHPQDGRVGGASSPKNRLSQAPGTFLQHNGSLRLHPHIKQGPLTAGRLS